MILDTHAVLWLFLGDTKLGDLARRHATAALNTGALYASTVSFFEITTLVRRDRLDIAVPARNWRDNLFDEGLIELDVTAEIAIAAGELDDLHGDPMDRLIVATAIEYGLTLVTADRRILEWRGDLTRHDART